RRILKILFAKLRGDDDFVGTAVAVRRLLDLRRLVLVLGVGGCGQARRECKRRYDAERLELHQASSPGESLFGLPRCSPSRFKPLAARTEWQAKEVPGVNKDRCDPLPPPWAKITQEGGVTKTAAPNGSP